MYVLVEHCGLGYLICMVMISISALFSLNIIFLITNKQDAYKWLSALFSILSILVWYIEKSSISSIDIIGTCDIPSVNHYCIDIIGTCHIPSVNHYCNYNHCVDMRILIDHRLVHATSRLVHTTIPQITQQKSF